MRTTSVFAAAAAGAATTGAGVLSGSRAIGRGLWKVGDQTLIDGVVVNGSAKLVGWLASVARLLQTGRMNNYAVSMIIGVGVLMLFVVLPLIRR